MNDSNNIKSPSPGSVTNFWMNLGGIILFFGAVLLGYRFLPAWNSFHLAVFGLLVTVVPLWIYDLAVLKVQRRESTGLTAAGEVDRERVVVKLIGLYATFFVILVLYYLNPFYFNTPRAAQFYNLFFSLLNVLAPWIVGGSFLYFREMDRRQRNPYDGYWQIGCLLTGRRKELDAVIMGEHARVWFVKAFFLPFMFASLVVYIDGLLLWQQDRHSALLMFNHVFNALYAVDVIYGVLGYLLTLRWTDTHIQSTDPTWLGWLACLACYHPFYSIFGLGRFSHEDGFYWEHWLSGVPVLFYLCGFLIIFLTLIYALATVAFGYRMSNLTYRGLITSGPYRWTKHPAYIGKVGSWWLLSLPFLSIDGAGAAIHNTVNLLLITFIYYVRARTEENHLSNCPEYVQYANWINEHGIFRSLGRIFPVLRYSEEKCKRWNSVVWFKRVKPSK